MNHEWDPAKERANRENHGVSFEDAKRVFEDPLSETRLDGRFDYGEDRFVTVGHAGDRLYIVIHTDRDGATRIISARLATPSERRAYARSSGP